MELKDLVDEVLRKIGKNMMLFQQLELEVLVTGSKGQNRSKWKR